MKNSKKIILVTGAGGFIGKNLCQYLIKNGYHVRVMLHKNLLSEASLKKTEIVYGDLRSINSLLNATKKVDIVINLAARKLDEKDSYEVNVKGVQNLLKSCQINSVKKIIQISSQSAKISKKGIYGKTKQLADEVIQKSNIPYVILRVSLVYGNTLEGVFGSVAKFSRLPFVPVFGDGNWISNPIHADDLSKVIEKSLFVKKLQNKIWDVGGGDSITFNDLIISIAERFGKKPHIIHIPVWIGLSAAKLTALLLKNPPITVSNILGSTQNTYPEINYFIKNFNISPISLKAGLDSVLKDEDAIAQEIKIISKYILSVSDINFNPDPDFKNNYKSMLTQNKISPSDKVSKLMLKFPWTIAGLEIYLKFFSPNAPLLKKMLILTALLESHPSTAFWLLPSETKTGVVLKNFSMAIGRIIFKYLFAVLLAPFLYFYYKDERY